jgi:hypothetical protein
MILGNGSTSFLKKRSKKFLPIALSPRFKRANFVEFAMDKRFSVLFFKKQLRTSLSFQCFGRSKSATRATSAGWATSQADWAACQAAMWEVRLDAVRWAPKSPGAPDMRAIIRSPKAD